MMIIGAMDLSLTSPGITYGNRFQNNPSLAIRDIFFGTSTAGLEKKLGGWRFVESPKGLSKKTEEYRLQRLHFLYSKIIASIHAERPSFIAIEDYGFMGKGAGFYPVELGGLVKHWLWMRNIPFRLYDPQAIKMFVFGRGDANKREMMQAVSDRWDIDVEQYKTSATDIADSIGILYLLHNELLARENPNLVPDMPESTRRVLNRVTKSNPENILTRPFIQRVGSDSKGF